jgi:histidinol-phosphatase
VILAACSPQPAAVGGAVGGDSGGAVVPGVPGSPAVPVVLVVLAVVDDVVVELCGLRFFVVVLVPACDFDDALLSHAVSATASPTVTANVRARRIPVRTDDIAPAWSTTARGSGHSRIGPGYCAAIDADLALALELADAADGLTTSRFRANDLQVSRKPDTTHVTEADHATEQLLRDGLQRARPGDAILGEEFGTIGAGRRRWILDPIDGTANYVRGVPIWATLIALEEDGELRVGVVSAPALHTRWYAARGEGAYANERPISVSKVGDLADAQLCYSDIASWTNFRTSAQPMIDLLHRVWRSRGVGDFLQHMLVAEGAADVAVEPIVNLWDLAPLLVVVEEAGGRFTNLEGVRTADGGSAVSTNGLLHGDVLDALSAAGPASGEDGDAA